jgi:hypothetical protein
MDNEKLFRSRRPGVSAVGLRAAHGRDPLRFLSKTKEHFHYRLLSLEAIR